MKNSNLVKGAALAILAAFISACGTQQEASENEISHPVVSVAQVVNERLTEWDTFTGRLEAPQNVELRARVSGYIDQVTFEEGAVVEAGDTLFVIDDRKFRAEVQRIEAELKSAQAKLTLAATEFERAEKLIARNAISTELLDQRRSQYSESIANVESMKASLQLAQLQLSYTRVEAPISGRVSRAMVTKGNYVNAGQSVLTSLVSIDKVYAYFDADEQTYLNYVRLAKEGARPSSRTNENPVVMGLANQKDFPYQGYIDFVDNQINPASGTIRGRAVFDNADGTFIPGLFARIKLVGSATYKGILIDDKAIGTDLNNKFVLVLGDDNVVKYRAVELGEKLNGLRIIKSGLNPEDRIVVNGLQRVRPGATVAPQLVQMADQDTMSKLQQAQLMIDQAFSRKQVAQKASNLPLSDEVDG